MPSTDRQRWARVQPHLAWKHPGIPREWVRVLERHPEGIQGLSGHVWLETPEKVRSVREDWLEFTDGTRPDELPHPLVRPKCCAIRRWLQPHRWFSRAMVSAPRASGSQAAHRSRGSRMTGMFRRRSPLL